MGLLAGEVYVFLGVALFVVEFGTGEGATTTELADELLLLELQLARQARARVPRMPSPAKSKIVLVRSLRVKSMLIARDRVDSVEP